jgi:hypothetical protein
MELIFLPCRRKLYGVFSSMLVPCLNYQVQLRWSDVGKPGMDNFTFHRPLSGISLNILHFILNQNLGLHHSIYLASDYVNVSSSEV